MRIDADDVDLDGGNAVAAAQHEARQRRDRRRQQLTVGAEIRNRARLEAENRPVVLHRHFVLADLVPPVDRARGVFATRFDPLHGRVQPHREVAAERLLRIDVQLRAKAAADLRRDNPQLVLGHADHGRQERPQQVRDLRRRPQRERPFAGMVRGHHGPRLDRHGRETLVVQAVLDHAVRPPEGIVDVAAAQDRLREGDVGTQLRMRERRAFPGRCLRVGHDRQRIVVDVDGVDGVACDVRIGGNRDGHRVAREIDPVVGEHGVRRRLEIRNRRRTGHEPARVVDVGAGEHGDDSGNRLRGAGIDAHNPRVRVRAAQDARMQHARQPHVVGIGADPLHQPRIFDALHRAPDVGSSISHGPPPTEGRGVRRRRRRRFRRLPAGRHR